jgi:hypothetical protein
MRERESTGPMGEPRRSTRRWKGRALERTPLWLYVLVIAGALGMVGWRFAAARVEAQRLRAKEAARQADEQQLRRLEEIRLHPEQRQGRPARQGR